MKKKNIFNVSSPIAYIIFFMICERMLGCSGSGIVIASMTLFGVLFTILMGSVMNTLGKMVLVRIKKGFFDGAKRVFGYCLIYALFAGGLGFAILSLFSAKLGRLFFGDSSPQMILVCLGIYFFVDAVVKTIRGYYLGCEASGIYIIALVLKNVSLVILGPIFIKLFAGVGQKAANLHKNDFLLNVYGSIGAVAAMCAADILMLFVLVIGLRGVLHSDEFSFNEVRTKDGYSSFLKSFLPFSFNLLKENLFPIVTIFMSICFYCRYAFANGETPVSVYSNVGVVGVPGIITVIFCFIFYKNFVDDYKKQIRVSFNKEAENKNSVSSLFITVLKNGCIMVVPAAITVMFYSKAISSFIYGCENPFAKTIMIWCGVVILFKGIDIGLAKSLEAVKRDNLVFIGRIVGFACALLLCILVGKSGIKPTTIAIALAVDIIIATLIHGYFAITGIRGHYNDVLATLVKVIIACVPMIIVELLTSIFLTKNIILLIISIVISYCLYLVGFMFLRGASQKDIVKMSGSLMFYPLSLLNSVLGIK